MPNPPPSSSSVGGGGSNGNLGPNGNNPAKNPHQNTFQIPSFSGDVDMALLGGGPTPDSTNRFGMMNDNHILGGNNSFGNSIGGLQLPPQNIPSRTGTGSNNIKGGAIPNQQMQSSAFLQQNQHMPIWSGGSINVADFAFSMSPHEQAELDRLRKGNTSSAGTRASVDSSKNNANNMNTMSGSGSNNASASAALHSSQIPPTSNTASHQLQTQQLMMMQQQQQQQQSHNPTTDHSSSGALGLQNSSMSANNLSASSMLNTNNNLSQQQYQFLMNSAAAQPNMQQSMTQQQQMIMQQNLHRQAAVAQQQKNQQMLQSTMMQNRPMGNSFAAQNPQHLQHYQQQQQQLQNLMMSGGTNSIPPTRTTSAQSMQRPSPGFPNNGVVNNFNSSNAFPNQAMNSVYNSQQQMLLNQHMKLQQQQQQQQQQLFMQSQQQRSGVRIQTMNTFDGTVHAAFNDRTQFEVHFATYVAQLQLPSPPVIMGASIDVFLLFHTVYQAKGFHEVTRGNGWAGVCHRIGLDTSPATQSAVHGYYQKSMLPLEVNTRKGVAAAGSGTPRIEEDVSGGGGGGGEVKVEGVDTPRLGPTPGPETSAETGVKEEDGEEDGVDEGKYLRKVRFLKSSFGGVDWIGLREVAQIASRYKVTKELFAPRSYTLLDTCLRSGLPGHVRFALDMMVAVSGEQAINFPDCPELFRYFLIFFKEQLDESFPPLPKLEKAKSSPFRGYAELFEIEYGSLAQLQPNTQSSLDPIAQSANYASACSLILRNCSFMPTNAQLMAMSSDCASLLLKCLDLCSIGGARIENQDSRHLAASYPKTLEHRKNALVSLSYLSEFLRLTSTADASLIMRVCTDFIQEESGSYKPIALSIIAKLLVVESNQKVFEEAKHRCELCKALLDLFPWTGYQLTPGIFQLGNLGEWEHALTILTVLLNADSPDLLAEVCSVVPGIDRIFFNLHRRPVVIGMRSVSTEFHSQFASLRERALQLLFVFIRYFRHTDLLKHERWERELLDVTHLAMKNDVDGWSVGIIYGLLTAEYCSQRD